MANHKLQSVRIIGGKWRRRRLSFAPAAGLRPTPDRVRETLFNWLATRLPGARCLDLFAGSGALGFEAASRGAQTVLMVDSERDVAATLERQVDEFDAGEQVSVLQADALRWLRAYAAEPFDIIFLDPPYDTFEMTSLCADVARAGLVAAGGFVYFECREPVVLEVLPNGWTLHRQRRAGQVHYYLLAVDDARTVQ